MSLIQINQNVLVSYPEIIFHSKNISKNKTQHLNFKAYVAPREVPSACVPAMSLCFWNTAA